MRASRFPLDRSSSCRSFFVLSKSQILFQIGEATNRKKEDERRKEPFSEECGEGKLEPGAFSCLCGVAQSSTADAEAKPCEGSIGKAKAKPLLGVLFDRLIAKLKAKKLARERNLAVCTQNSQVVVAATSATSVEEMEHIRPLQSKDECLTESVGPLPSEDECLVCLDGNDEGKSDRSLVETGAAHTEISSAEVRRLGLTLGQSEGNKVCHPTN